MLTHIPYVPFVTLVLLLTPGPVPFGTCMCSNVGQVSPEVVYGGVFVLSIGFRIFCWYMGFYHRTESDLLLFLFISGLWILNFPRYFFSICLIMLIWVFLFHRDTLSHLINPQYQFFVFFIPTSVKFWCFFIIVFFFDVLLFSVRMKIGEKIKSSEHWHGLKNVTIHTLLAHDDGVHFERWCLRIRKL